MSGGVVAGVVVGVAVIVGVVKQVPEIRRYLKVRKM